MWMTDQFRRYRCLLIPAMLCLTLPGFAISQTDTSTSPPKAPSTKTSQKVRRPVSAPATTARTSGRTTTHTTAQKGKTARGKKTSESAANKSVAAKRGQQAIDASRAREIQTALIREHYLQGEPTGTWDSGSQAAMQKYQADHGWQSKITPDARALIKLGLGPSQDHLLNPESAMTATNGSNNAQAGSARAVAPDPGAKTPVKPTPPDGTPQR
jgi:hypothetical protein